MTLGANGKPADKIYQLTSVKKYPPLSRQKMFDCYREAILEKIQTDFDENRI